MVNLYNNATSTDLRDPEQLAVVTKAIIISRILYALPAWGGFLFVELVAKTLA